MPDNEFILENLADGRIKVTSTGGFDQEIHQSAEDFLQYVKDLAGGKVETKKNQQHLHSPHHSHAKGQQHHKH